MTVLMRRAALATLAAFLIACGLGDDDDDDENNDDSRRRPTTTIAYLA
jgi:hypothetical protein